MYQYRLRIKVRRERLRSDDFEYLEAYETIEANSKYDAEKLIVLKYWPASVWFLKDDEEFTPARRG